LKIAYGAPSSPSNQSAGLALYIDFLRKEFGHTRTENGRIKVAAKRDTAELKESYHQHKGPPPEPKVDGVNIALLLDTNEQYVFEMSSEGASQPQIADFLGVTPGRISQIMKSIRQKTKDADELAHLKDMLKLSPETSVLSIEWITI
jgi:hypothetical protein